MVPIDSIFVATVIPSASREVIGLTVVKVVVVNLILPTLWAFRLETFDRRCLDDACETNGSASK